MADHQCYRCNKILATEELLTQHLSKQTLCKINEANYQKLLKRLEHVEYDRMMMAEILTRILTAIECRRNGEPKPVFEDPPEFKFKPPVADPVEKKEDEEPQPAVTKQKKPRKPRESKKSLVETTDQN